MKYQPILFFCLLFGLPFGTAAQTNTESAKPQSQLLRFEDSGATEPDRVVLNVLIREQGAEEPVLGATALLQRQNPDQVHGKISQWDGQCKFKVAPGKYDFRIQLTGLVTFEKRDIELAAGRQYDLEVEMARLSQPVPSAKQQAGN